MRRNSCICAFIIAMMISFTPQMISPVQALFFKFDMGKSTSKITNFIEKIKAKCEKIMEDIQNSQFGQFVGNGIKDTKAMLAFAQSKVQQGMAYYNKTKKKTLNSAEYKTAMISKEIADKGMDLKKLEEEKLIKQEEIKQEIELLKKQTAGKVEALMQNLSLLESGGDINLLEDVRTLELENIELQIQETENKLQENIAALELEFNSINEEYRPQEIAIGEEIAELTKELAEAVDDTGALNKKKEKSAKERMNKDHEELSLPEGSEVTPAERTRIRKARKKKEQKNNKKAMVNLATERNEISTMESEVKSVSQGAKSQPGESETSGVATQVLSKQVVLVRSYISLMIADLKTQVINEIVTFDKPGIPKAKEKFNLCDYTDPENQKKKSLISKAAEGIDKVKESVQNVTEKTGQIIEKGQQLKEKAEEAVSTVTDVGSAVKDLSESVGNGNAADLINNMGVM